MKDRILSAQALIAGARVFRVNASGVAAGMIPAPANYQKETIRPGSDVMVLIRGFGTLAKRTGRKLLHFQGKYRQQLLVLLNSVIVECPS